MPIVSPAARSLAVLADNSPSWVIADLAALAVGITHVPLPTFFNGEQLAHVLESAGVETILTDQPERIGALDLGFAITGRWHDLIRLQRPAVARAATPVGTAKVSFTSGSTGNPKGACLTACGLLDTAKTLFDLADIKRVAETDPVGSPEPFSEVSDDLEIIVKDG